MAENAKHIINNSLVKLHGVSGVVLFVVYGGALMKNPNGRRIQLPNLTKYPFKNTHISYINFLFFSAKNTLKVGTFSNRLYRPKCVRETAFQNFHISSFFRFYYIRWPFFSRMIFFQIEIFDVLSNNIGQNLSLRIKLISCCTNI